MACPLQTVRLRLRESMAVRLLVAHHLDGLLDLGVLHRQHGHLQQCGFLCPQSQKSERESRASQRNPRAKSAWKPSNSHSQSSEHTTRRTERTIGWRRDMRLSRWAWGDCVIQRKTMHTTGSIPYSTAPQTRSTVRRGHLASQDAQEHTTEPLSASQRIRDRLTPHVPTHTPRYVAFERYRSACIMRRCIRLPGMLAGEVGQVARVWSRHSA